MTQQKFPNISEIKTVASLGGGPIGGGWSAHFLAQGYDVRAYLHSMDEEASFRTIVETAWVSLQDLGLAKGASLDRLFISSDLEDVVLTAEFIQESGPERLDIKQSLYKRLGDIVAPHIVIASSTSGLMMSDIHAECATPERTLVGHPFNPPYLLPLVELVGGEGTDADAIEWAHAFYRHAGKEPLIFKGDSRLCGNPPARSVMARGTSHGCQWRGNSGRYRSRINAWAGTADGCAGSMYGIPCSLW